jgi:hypothetical protein
VFSTGRTENGGVGGKKGYIFPSSCDFFVQLVRHDNFNSYLVFSLLMNTKQPSLHHAQPLGTPGMRSIEMRFSTRVEAS